jgi:hypothetical protein
MKHLKMHAAAVIAGILIVSLITSAFAAAFPDTNGHWADSIIAKYVAAGAVVGYPDGTFKPDNQISKAEFASILSRYLKLSTLAPNTYSDVKDSDWFAQAILKMVASGAISADSTGAIKPNAALLRSEMFIITAKAYGLKSVSGKTSFLDDASIPADAKGYIKALQDANLISGYAVTGGYEVRANITSTRAEALSVYDRFVSNYVGAGTVTPLPDGWNPVVDPNGYYSGYWDISTPDWLNVSGWWYYSYVDSNGNSDWNMTRGYYYQTPPGNGASTFYPDNNYYGNGYYNQYPGYYY